MYYILSPQTSVLNYTIVTTRLYNVIIHNKMYIYFFFVHRGSVIWIIVSANNSKIRFYNNMYTRRVPADADARQSHHTARSFVFYIFTPNRA